MDTHEIHDDDKPVGRLLSRREMLRFLGGTSMVLVAGVTLPEVLLAQTTATATPDAMALPACVVRPELSEGPFFVDDQLNRWDIRVDPRDESIKAGLPFLLKYRVSDVTGGMCAPLVGAQIDVWHCDADGVYPGVQDQGSDTTDEMWLRGYQVTDENGLAEFLTIIPGWYRGRAVHIHFKIRPETEEGDSYEFTSQLFFDPEVIAVIYTEAPYASKGSPDTSNSRDMIFQRSDGQLTLELVPLEAEELEEMKEMKELEIEGGFSATFDVGLDLS